MPPRKSKGDYIKADPEIKRLLRKITKHSGKSQLQVMTILFNLCDVYDFLKEDWQERLEAALRAGDWQLQREKHFANKNRCLGLREADQKWKCIQGREGKIPMIRMLAENREDALNLCEGCTLTLEPILQNKEYQKQIAHLQDRLNQKASVTYKVPICHKGATLNEDSTEFSGCPKHPGENVSIEKFCKVYSSGLPCMLYAERVIGVSDSESEIGSEPNR